MKRSMAEKILHAFRFTELSEENVFCFHVMAFPIDRLVFVCGIVQWKSQWIDHFFNQGRYYWEALEISENVGDSMAEEVQWARFNKPEHIRHILVIQLNRNELPPIN